MNPRTLRLTLLALLILGIGLAVAYTGQLDPVELKRMLERWIGGVGVAGPVVFLLLYTVATVLFLPGSILTLVGGVLFGPIAGTVYSLTGATVGAALSFLVSRYLASDWVEQRASGWLKRVKQGVEGEGWRFVAFARLMPFFPFNALNYALGLTRIPFGQYLVATWFFMIPGAFAYTYLGYASREAITGDEALVQKGLLALALLAAVAFLPSLVARLRRGPTLSVDQLHQQLEAHTELLLLDVRNPDEFTGELGHVQQSRNIPLPELAGRIGEIEDFLEKPVAIICHTDARSARAAQLLARNGFADVHVIRHGMTAWNQAGYAVEH